MTNRPPPEAWHATWGGSEPVFLIGDVHGCADELEALLALNEDAQVIFVGDLVNKGPKSKECIRLAREVNALGVRGNHEQAVLKALQKGKENRKPSYDWIDDLDAEDIQFLNDLPFTLTLTHYNTIVVHAGLVPGIPLEQQALDDLVSMRHLKQTEAGQWEGCEKPVVPTENMVPWASQWPQGHPHVVFGHDAIRRLQKHPNATGIDTGCLYGGELTALRLPGGHLVSVAAKRQYVVGTAKLLPSGSNSRGYFQTMPRTLVVAATTAAVALAATFLARL